MTTRLLLPLLAAALCAGSAAAALSYTRWAHPKGDYALEYPSDWKTSVGLETFKLSPPGRVGKTLRLSVEKYPVGRKDPSTPAAFIDGLIKDAAGLRRLDARDTIKVSGKDAERLVFTDTKLLKGPHHATLPGPMSEAVVVVAYGKGFYAVRMIGLSSDFPETRPEFDRLVSGLKLGASSR